MHNVIVLTLLIIKYYHKHKLHTILENVVCGIKCFKYTNVSKYSAPYQLREGIYGTHKTEDTKKKSTGKPEGRKPPKK
jgi:hypothetical protein